MSRVEKAIVALTFAAMASPAFAGVEGQVPAPIAGVGVGAVVLVGMGYRALKRRIGQ